MNSDVIVPQKPNKSKLSVGMGNNHRRNKMFNHKIKKIFLYFYGIRFFTNRNFSDSLKIPKYFFNLYLAYSNAFLKFN